MQNDVITIGKPEAIYDEFERKVGSDRSTTHYCPGCGHGRVQKYIALALNELGLQDRAIFLSSVGCAVFSYYYMKTGNIQCSHGRAPAVGTGVVRSCPKSVVISYQGDGDLAAIGGNEILQAANRGENMVVFFVNNAIYGMTGGQMAPTTVLGQKTLTTPTGREEHHGHPLKMCELLSTLTAPIYIERVSCTDLRGMTATRRAIKKALQLVSERKGFCFVEILSACPTNWKKTSLESIAWIKETLEPVFKPGVYRDLSATAQPIPLIEPIQERDQIFHLLGLEKGSFAPSKRNQFVGERRIKVAGFGGQGILTIGFLLANAGMLDGLEVSCMPSYGPEMRGGTANCSVVISDQKIGSPIFSRPDVLIAMNGPSLLAFEKDVQPGGIILVNSSMVSHEIRRTDVRVLSLPVSDIAAQLGDKTVANLVALGAYLAKDPIFDTAKIHEVIGKKLRKKEFLELNKKAFEAGHSFF